jgi:hypothetical protein
MKRLLLATALAVAVIAFSDQRASAWGFGATVNIGCGVGLTIACTGFSICGQSSCYTPPALYDSMSAGGGYGGGGYGGDGGYGGYDGHAAGGGYAPVASTFAPMSGAYMPVAGAYYGPQAYPTVAPAPVVQQAGYQAPGYWYGN